MAGQEGAAILAQGMLQTLEKCGRGVLAQPHELYGLLVGFCKDVPTMTDTLPEDLAEDATTELDALRDVLCGPDGASVLEPLASLDLGSAEADVKRAAERIERSLVSDHLLEEDVAASCAGGLSAGMALFLGIGSDEGDARQPQEAAFSLDDEAKPLDLDLDRRITVDVPADKLGHGWSTSRVLVPMSIKNAGARPKPIPGREGETVRIYIPAGKKVGDEVRISGQGYFGPDVEPVRIGFYDEKSDTHEDGFILPRRGDLVVTVGKGKASTARTKKGSRDGDGDSRTGCFIIVLVILIFLAIVL